MKQVFISEMTWIEIKDLLTKVQVAVVPTGSTEQHGPHLPLQSDTSFCLYLCRRAAEEAYPTTLVTPPVAIGISSHHMRFAGTLTLTPETFIDVIYEISSSLKHHGIGKIAIVNGHGGNSNAIKVASRKIFDGLKMSAAAFSYWDLLPEEAAQNILETYPTVPGHACEFETSLSYIVQPELLKKSEIPESDGIKLSKYQEMMAKYDTEVCSMGVPVGDPRAASKQKGKKLIDVLVKELRDFLLYYAEHGDKIGQ